MAGSSGSPPCPPSFHFVSAQFLPPTAFFSLEFPLLWSFPQAVGPKTIDAPTGSGFLSWYLNVSATFFFSFFFFAASLFFPLLAPSESEFVTIRFFFFASSSPVSLPLFHKLLLTSFFLFPSSSSFAKKCCPPPFNFFPSSLFCNFFPFLLAALY